MKTQHSPEKLACWNQPASRPSILRGRGEGDRKGLRFVRDATEAEGKVETGPGDLPLCPSAQGFLLPLPSGVGTS